MIDREFVRIYLFTYYYVFIYLFIYLYMFIYSRIETLTNSDHVTCNSTVPMSAGRSCVRPRIPEDSLFRDIFRKQKGCRFSQLAGCAIKLVKHSGNYIYPLI
jgi:hypothetical protein